MRRIEIETCAFCDSDAELRKSHIVPRFVWGWLKDSSATGFLRMAGNIDNRKQDGHKERLLCQSCEQLFSGWEKTTAETVFMPMHNQNISTIPYDVWFAKFCASVCWRVLYCQRHLGLTHLTPDLKQKADDALCVWREFLLGNREDTGQHELHVVPVAQVDSTTMQNASPNLNRYLMRSVDTDVVGGERSAFVYAKMCRLMVFGFISVEEASHWQGTKIGIPAGDISPRTYEIPAAVGEFLNNRAVHCFQLAQSMSARQQAKLDNWIRENPGKVASSESFEAMQQDVELFGDAAFSPGPGEDE